MADKTYTITISETDDDPDYWGTVKLTATAKACLDAEVREFTGFTFDSQRCRRGWSATHRLGHSAG